MKTGLVSLIAMSGALAAPGCDTSDGSGGGEPIGIVSSPLGDAVARAMAANGLAAVSADLVELEHELVQPVVASTQREVTPEMCAEVQSALDAACQQVAETGAYQFCWGYATFLFANTTPRCAARALVATSDDDHFHGMYAVDFSGEPYDGPAPECGNGTLEPGEECDDGNTDEWDGCDAACYFEAFNGCEAVIEHHYRVADVAAVDQAMWDGKASHTMTHRRAAALRPVTESACNAALAVGADVCNELSLTMPFVSWCQPTAEAIADADGPGCAVRFEVGFLRADPSAGVYTVNLSGVLAFTIR